MITIGIRVAPKFVVFAIYNTDEAAVLTVEKINVPAAFNPPEALKYVRSNLLDILREYKVEQAGLRTTEPSAQSKNIDRIQFEGVILEAFASSELKNYYIGHVSSISAKIGIERNQFKNIIENKTTHAVENWENMKKRSVKQFFARKEQKMLKPHNRAEVQFDFVREIGHEGRNSKAYIVHDVQLDTEIVMKRIPKTDLDSQDRYFEEARTLQATSHQNVVPILYACEDTDHIYLALPYLQNGSLKSLMLSGNLTVREIVRLGCQLLSGLHNIHSKKLIHFDIKPDNVLLSDRGEALLSDFGLARQMYLGQAMQTRFYIPIVAPEVLSSQQFDLRFDIYQFGLTLYRMCCGEAALRTQFTTLRTKQDIADALQNGTYPSRSTFPEHIPDRLRRVVVRCLEVDPSARFQSALEVANALALVNECLDWRFEHSSSGKTWVRSDGETERKFQVYPNGSTEFISTKQGRERRKAVHCCDSMTEAKVKQVLKVEG